MDFDRENKTWKYDISPDEKQLKENLKRFEKRLDKFNCNWLVEFQTKYFWKKTHGNSNSVGRQSWKKEMLLSLAMGINEEGDLHQIK